MSDMTYKESKTLVVNFVLHLCQFYYWHRWTSKHYLTTSLPQNHELQETHIELLSSDFDESRHPSNLSISGSITRHAHLSHNGGEPRHNYIRQHDHDPQPLRLPRLMAHRHPSPRTHNLHPRYRRRLPTGHRSPLPTPRALWHRTVR